MSGPILRKPPVQEATDRRPPTPDCRARPLLLPSVVWCHKPELLAAPGRFHSAETVVDQEHTVILPSVMPAPFVGRLKSHTVRNYPSTSALLRLPQQQILVFHAFPVHEQNAALCFRRR